MKRESQSLIFKLFLILILFKKRSTSFIGNKKHFSKPLGMSLVEVMIALIILSGGLLLISSSWSGSFSRLRKTQQTVELSAFLQKKMLEIDMEYRGKALDSIPDEKEGDFGSEFPLYRWKMESKNFEMMDLTSTLLSKEGGAKQESLQYMSMFTEQLSKSIKEVKLTIFYKPKPTKEVSYSLTTYYIDFDKEISFGGLENLNK